MKKGERRKKRERDSYRMRAGFTLLELVVVVSVLSVLIIAVVLLLRPGEMAGRARDATRLSDLDSVADAILFAGSNAPIAEEGGYDPDGSNSGTCANESTPTVYVSVPLSETPPNDLPFGWGYGQVAEADLGRVDGNGWIPVDFTFGGTATPSISNLPIDASNKFSSGFYYSYICHSNDTFELTARMTSDERRTGGPGDVQSDDGGDDIFAYEVGSDLSLDPKPPVGYWAFEEGSGTTTLDSAGNYGGTLVDGPVWVTSGCVRGNCLLLDGLNDRVQTITSDPFEYRGEGLTTVAWHRPASTDVDGGNIFSNPWNGSGQYNHRLAVTGANTAFAYLVGATAYSLNGGSPVSEDNWHQFAMTVDKTDLVNVFTDGTSDNSGTHSIVSWVPSPADANTSPLIGCYYPYGSGWAGNTTFCAGGEVDEVAFYDRALSPTELKYQYDSLKP